MSANSFGNRLKMTSFGESHGVALGVVIDGLPAGIPIDKEILLNDLNRRRPGQNQIVSSRAEADEPEILSGVFENKSLGTPICVIVRNKDARSEDYESIKQKSRPGHADDLWKEKFHHTDHRGGGRSSGRETLSRVIAGSFAKMFLKHTLPDLNVYSFSSEIYHHSIDKKMAIEQLSSMSQQKGEEWIDSHTARFTDSKHPEIEKLLLDAKESGKSYGGKALLLATGIPSGLGQPVFHKIKADLASACLGVGATFQFQLGLDLNTQEAEGSKVHDENHTNSIYGGIRGGMTSGEPLVMEVGFKPTSSVLDIAKKGRHDPCIVPRACVVLQAMAHFVLADHLLWAQTDRLDKIST